MNDVDLIFPEKRFQVRDLRAKQRFVMDDEFFNGYVNILGSDALAVYCAICRHADKEMKCFPSLKKMKEELCLSIDTISVRIKALELFGIVKIIRVGKTCTNRYYLIDKKHWIKDFTELSRVITDRQKSGDLRHKYFTILTGRIQRHDRQKSIVRKHNSKETHRKEIGFIDEERRIFVKS